jgi:hypothetical protein
MSTIVTHALDLLREAGITPATFDGSRRTGLVHGWWRDQRDGSIHLTLTAENVSAFDSLILLVDRIDRALQPLTLLPGVTMTRDGATVVHVVARTDMSRYISHDHGFATEPEVKP